MINLPAGARVLLATRPVDFRKGAYGLTALASEVLGIRSLAWRLCSARSDRTGEDPGVGHKRCGAGVEAAAAGRLPLGPPVMDGVMRLSAVEFAALFDGLDWTRVQTRRGIPAPTTAA